MRMSEAGIIDLVADEGESLTAYRDLVGVLTIGVGLTKASGVIDPKPGMRITQSESRALLRAALQKNYEPAVNKALGTVRQHEFDPAVSFHFNTGAISRASWVKHFKARNMSAARDAFLAWNKAGGRVVAGLANRRQREWLTLSTGMYHHTKALKTSATKEALDAAVASTQLKRGSVGDQVRKLQSDLKELGHYKGNIDGDFGPNTELAVRAFQGTHPNLRVDGIAGVATLTTLQRMLDAKSKAKNRGAAGAGGAVAGGGVNEMAHEQGLTAFATMDVVVAIAIITIVILGFLAFQYRDEIRAFTARDPIPKAFP